MTNRLLQDEELRIDTLDSFDVFGTEPEAELDEIAQLAAQVCGVEAAVIALVGATRVWFKSRIGIPAAEPQDAFGSVAAAGGSPMRRRAGRDLEICQTAMQAATARP